MFPLNAKGLTIGCKKISRKGEYKMTLLEYILQLRYLAFSCWALFSIFTVIGLLGLLYKPKRRTQKAENVNFVVVTIACLKVKKSLLESIYHTKEMFPNYPLWIVCDQGAELIDELGNIPQVNVVVVPENYRKDLLAKGRAINYFIETYVLDKQWYAFIDDDNLILDDNFLYEIPYYNRRKCVAANPILIPRPGKSKVTYVMDFVRYFDDLTMFKLFTGLIGRPFKGLHGELLLVKGKILKEVGFARKSTTEDFRFATELVRRKYKTWQTSTKVSILSPNNIKDLQKQRARWFTGILGDLKHCPILMRIVVTTMMVTWGFGVFGSWLLFPLWFFWGGFIYAIPGAIFWWFIYIYGAIIARKPHYIFLIPAFSVIESTAYLMGLLKRKEMKEFVVIDKS